MRILGCNGLLEGLNVEGGGGENPFIVCMAISAAPSGVHFY